MATNLLYVWISFVTVLSDWMLVLRHKDTESGYFNKTILNSWIENVDNVDANTYSIIGNLNLISFTT